MKYFSFLISLLVLTNCGYFESDKEQQAKEKRAAYKIEEIEGLNKSFEYQIDKISVLESIGKDTVSNIYKDYLESYSSIIFAPNSLKITDYTYASPEKQPFKIDLVNTISGKYSYPKKTVYKVFKIIDNEKGIYDLNDIIETLDEENIELQEKLEKYEE